MLNEYQNLLKYVNKMNNIEGEKCLICHFPDKKNNLIQLSCKHFFHSRCLDLKDSKYIICPYCDCKTFKNDLNSFSDRCSIILKSGVNKGKPCNRSNCKLHKK